MKRDRCTRSAKRRYHHGNLRAALIEVAERLIVDKGPGGFTLVEAATSAGVSPAAPYRHFKNREALLAEVARAGFERFAEKLQIAWDDGRPDALTALRRMGDEYMHFARYERASYIAMFEAEMDKDNQPDLQAVSRNAYDILTRACAALGGKHPDGTPANPELMSAHIWALSHGIATLFGAGPGNQHRSDDELKEMFNAGVATYLHGLGIDA
jgi:AcrR family transcriptional regulator